MQQIQNIKRKMYVQLQSLWSKSGGQESSKKYIKCGIYCLKFKKNYNVMTIKHLFLYEFFVQIYTYYINTYDQGNRRSPLFSDLG